jgi:Kef-type K+ transport system membrane component KefB
LARCARGLTELIVLSVGLSTKLLDTQLFTAFVLMAVVTTAMTNPLLSVIKPDPELLGKRVRLGVSLFRYPGRERPVQPV